MSEINFAFKTIELIHLLILYQVQMLWYQFSKSEPKIFFERDLYKILLNYPEILNHYI